MNVTCTILHPLPNDVVIHDIIKKDLDVWLGLQAIPTFARECLSKKKIWKRYFQCVNIHQSDRICETCEQCPTLTHAIACLLDSENYYLLWGWDDISCHRPFTLIRTTKVPFLKSLFGEDEPHSIIDCVYCKIDQTEAQFSLNGEIFQHKQNNHDRIITYEYKFGLEEFASNMVFGKGVFYGNSTWRVSLEISNGNGITVESWENDKAVGRTMALNAHHINSVIGDCIPYPELRELLLDDIPVLPVDIRDGLDTKAFETILGLYENARKTQKKNILPDCCNVYYCEKCDYHVAVGDEGGCVDMRTHCGCETGTLFTTLRKEEPTDFFEENFIDKFTSLGGNGAPLWMQNLLSDDYRINPWKMFGIPRGERSMKSKNNSISQNVILISLGREI